MITAVLERCAGIDIGRKQLNVCILDGPAADEPQITLGKFGTHASELESLRRWLEEHGCTHVAMDSTGSYWKPVFEALEQDMTVVAGQRRRRERPARAQNRLAGLPLPRPSVATWTDSSELHSAASHPRSARFDAPSRQLIGDATSERNRIQKVLDEASVGIGQVLGDVFGVSVNSCCRSS